MFVIAAVLSFTVFADTIRLKDGGIIKGKITGFADGRFVVVVGEGERRRELSFSASDVESVTFEGQSVGVRPGPSTNAGNVQKAPPKVVISDTSTATNRPEPVRPEPVAVRSPDPVQSRSDDVPISAPIRRTSSAKPVEVSVKVMADNTSNGWTNSGWVVRKGQKIRITGSGEISIGGGKRTAPGGLYDVEDQAKLLKAVPTGALIAVIGDDNNDFIYVGGSREFVAARDGALFLGVNEGNLNDNSGTFDVKIEIDPEGE
jgi:hypothetical protein